MSFYDHSFFFYNFISVIFLLWFLSLILFIIFHTDFLFGKNRSFFFCFFNLPFTHSLHDSRMHSRAFSFFFNPLKGSLQLSNFFFFYEPGSLLYKHIQLSLSSTRNMRNDVYNFSTDKNGKYDVQIYISVTEEQKKKKKSSRVTCFVL